jgi:hypothetical protein
MRYSPKIWQGESIIALWKDRLVTRAAEVKVPLNENYACYHNLFYYITLRKFQ